MKLMLQRLWGTGGRLQRGQTGSFCSATLLCNAGENKSKDICSNLQELNYEIPFSPMSSEGL